MKKPELILLSAICASCHLTADLRRFKAFVKNPGLFQKIPGSKYKLDATWIFLSSDFSAVQTNPGQTNLHVTFFDPTCSADGSKTNLDRGNCLQLANNCMKFIPSAHALKLQNSSWVVHLFF